MPEKKTCLRGRETLAKEISSLLPPGWEITAVEENSYPHNFTRTGPGGRRFSLTGEPRMVRLRIEDSKGSSINRTMPVSPLYYMYVMPKEYRGVPLDRSRDRRDGEKFYARYIGSDRCAKYYLYYYFELSLPRPGDLSFNKLHALLRERFNLK